jgi:hypothetical protein
MSPTPSISSAMKTPENIEQDPNDPEEHMKEISDNLENLAFQHLSVPV